MIDARFEWFSISSGQSLPGEILDRWRPLAKLMTDAEPSSPQTDLPSNRPG